MRPPLGYVDILCRNTFRRVKATRRECDALANEQQLVELGTLATNFLPATGSDVFANHDKSLLALLTTLGLLLSADASGTTQPPYVRGGFFVCSEFIAERRAPTHRQVEALSQGLNSQPNGAASGTVPCQSTVCVRTGG